MSEFLQRCRLRPAGPGDAASLSKLAFRSKASWGYDIDFMKRCQAELTFSADQIESPRSCFVVCEADEALTGFYGLERQSDHDAELVALFVKPDLLRQGIGRLLIRHMLGEARRLGLRAVTIQGDPNAEDFYAAIGATAVGYRESASIPGRYLPVFRLEISEESA